ncbi:MAG: enoyl-CoA hydratase/isomerase family protein [Phycisphaerales bacterium]|jgi:methylglutaconyl-CoA hydratase
MSDLVKTTIDGGVCEIRMNRPDVRNAISHELIHAMEAAIASVEENHAIQVAVLSGEGKSFCAGMDLKAVAKDPHAMADMLRALSRVSRRLRRLRVPVIARVQGAAVGGGCGLMVVCDFAVTHASSKVGYPEVDLGICPAVVAPWLVKKIGAGPARAMLLLGGTMSGREGFERGLATHLVEDESQLDEQVAAIAKRLCAGGPHAMAATKRWLNELDGSYEDKVLDDAAELSATMIAGEEAQTRLRAVWSK